MANYGEIDVHGQVFSLDHVMYHSTVYSDDRRKNISGHDNDGKQKKKGLFALDHSIFNSKIWINTPDKVPNLITF
jgi:hypothetical protein